MISRFHLCRRLRLRQNEDMRQCLIYDRPVVDARKKNFLTLPDSKKSMWHIHEYEVKSGVLFLPDVPGPVERQDREKRQKLTGRRFTFLAGG
uniref:Uncharacterized protein n=1 Tax=Lactuca sativa TaxID=4236 RepID=A0A9R1VH16_LACSA|nr:hypothetical protein LSAT_V11C500278300 [Lactuca sativa]